MAQVIAATAMIAVVLAQRTEVRRPGLTAEDMRQQRKLVSDGKITADEFERRCYLAGKPGDVIDVERSAVNLLAANGMIRPCDDPELKALFESLCSADTLAKLELLIARQTLLSDLQATGNPENDTALHLVKRAEEKRAARLEPIPPRVATVATAETVDPLDEETRAARLDATVETDETVDPASSDPLNNADAQ